MRTKRKRVGRSAQIAKSPARRREGGNAGSRARGRARQCELEFRSWGGARRGAGRKPKGERALVPHTSRPAHKARFPLLITTRVRPELPSLRRAAEAACIRAALAAGRDPCSAGNEDGAPFQVVHHSIQSNHLHLIVEGDDRAAITVGMRGLLVRIARALNRLWSRSGSVFADRFHERVLLNPRQVRNALVYVLQNLRKHGIALSGPDPFSSGPEFDGWCPEAEPGRSERDRGGSRGSVELSRGSSLALRRAGRAGRAEIPSPKTWLLNVGWQRHGLIDPGEAPRSR